MITTNTLYFSELLPTDAPRLWQELSAVLEEHNIPYQLLPLTKDIWAVDYMPVQVSRSEFVQFCYDPSCWGGPVKTDSELR